MLLTPKPQKILFYSQYFESALLKTVNVDAFKNSAIEEELSKLKHHFTYTSSMATLMYEKDEMGEEEYVLKIDEGQIKILASTKKGAFYATQTLVQLLEEEKIQCCLINDYPLIKTRGVMLDISRSKVPSLKTLKEMVDLFKKLRYNHLELYVEGFSFEYTHFKKFLADENYISLTDLKELEAYANKYFIDLVPNQNGLGHMSDWLDTDEYHYLAECPNGFYIWGADRKASTLDPTNQDSIKFVEKLYDDMLPHFKSKYFNMNLDEPHEIGLGKSKELCENKGKEFVYLDYVKKLKDYVEKHQKTPMMWADVIINHQDLLPVLPKDIIYIDWGYNKNYDFSSHVAQMAINKIKFMLAPGTSTWSSLLGKYDDMYQSIDKATTAGKEYHAEGVIVTDWGDIGHLQYIVASLPGFITAGLKMWNDANENDVKNYLGKILNNDIFADVIIKLAHYTNLEGEYRDYGSRLFSSIMWAEHASRYQDKISFFLEKMKYNLVNDENINLLNKLFSSSLKTLDEIPNSIEVEEVKNTIFLLQILLEINKKLSLIINEKTIVHFEKEINLLKTYSDVHKKLWYARNNHAGFKMSNQRILWLEEILIGLNGKEHL